MCLAGGARALLLLALVLCQRAGRVDGKNDNYQMSDVCKKYFLRDLYRKIDGAVLTSQNERELDCAITFQTHSILQRFMLRFDQLQLDCNDHLYIYDGAHAVGSYKICAYLAFVVVTVAVDQEECDKTNCPGPLAYYKALGCSPVYEKEGDCCATKYNCDHLKERSTTKCYVNGKEYEIGDRLKIEDANPCDVGCMCYSGSDGIATFTCAVVDCFHGRGTPGCYLKNSPLDCCPGEEVCPENPEDRAICNVDGKEYRDGEYFSVESDPDLNCVCQPGYEGKNVEPFCAKPKHPYCSPDFRHASDVFNNCAPVYYSNQSPQTGCSVSSRCQNANDTVIHNEDNSKSADGNPDDEDVCHFGSKTMHRGDELNQATDYSSVCVKCVCEVPPLPTCQRLPDEECDVTKHPPFNNYNF